MKIHTFRLQPGQDLKKDIDKYVSERNIEAGVLISCVGNVTRATLRMADARFMKTFEDEGTYEIVSLVGTLEAGNSHPHLCISDKEGNAFGGHLKENTIVGVTAEVVIGEIPNTKFSREFDKNTGYKELIVQELNYSSHNRPGTQP